MYKYYGKDYQKDLQWVRKRDIDLRGFTLNAYGDVRSGPVLMKLMGYGPKYLNLELASYYVTRGKLTDLDVIVVEHTDIGLACDNGLVEMVKCLLAAGADKEKGDSIDRTPLMGAAEKGHIEIVRILLSAGAKKDKVDIDGMSLSIPRLRVVQDEDELYAEFLVEISVCAQGAASAVLFGSWRRNSQFRALAKSIHDIQRVSQTIEFETKKSNEKKTLQRSKKSYHTGKYEADDSPEEEGRVYENSLM